MQRVHALRVSGLGIVVCIFAFGFRVAAEQLAQQPLENILRDIPQDWQEGGWDKRQDLQQFIAQHADNAFLCARAQFYIAAQFYAERDHTHAIQAFEDLIRRYPSAWLECQKARFEVGQVYLFRLNDPKQALKAYQSAIEDFPESFISARALLMSGRAFDRMKETDAALEAFKKVIRDYAAYNREAAEAGIASGNLLIQTALASEESKNAEALKTAVATFRQALYACPPEESGCMKQAIDGVYRSLRVLDGNSNRADQFILYQKAGKSGEDGIPGTPDDLADPLEHL